MRNKIIFTLFLIIAIVSSFNLGSIYQRHKDAEKSVAEKSSFTKADFEVAAKGIITPVSCLEDTVWKSTPVGPSTTGTTDHLPKTYEESYATLQENGRKYVVREGIVDLYKEFQESIRDTAIWGRYSTPDFYNFMVYLEFKRKK
jgi:hypothetical protein